MSEFLLVAPAGWEQCSKQMLESAIAATGDFKNIQAYLDCDDFGGLGNILDENRFPSPEEITAATIVQDQIFIKTRFL